MSRIITSDEDCVDCLCRTCVCNMCNDSYSPLFKLGETSECHCDCDIGDTLVEDCPFFIADEG